jgi:hypothetical protein
MSAWGLGHDAELNDEVGGEVLGLDFAALFQPEPDEGGLVIALDGASIRAADEAAPIR